MKLAQQQKLPIAKLKKLSPTNQSSSIYIYIYIYIHTHTYKQKPHVRKYEILSCDVLFDKEFFHINYLLKCHIRDKN